jgi:arylsulfatase A
MNFNRRSFLKTAAGALASASAFGAAKSPNVVLIFADDMGYGDLGCYGSKIRTPNLDRMAKEGMRFTNFYSANPVCSPSRAALLTGRYPTRCGIPTVLWPQDTNGLSATEVTIPQMLKPKGYRSMAIGKWHLGDRPEFLPTNHGFDQYFGIPYSNDMTPRVLMRNTEVIEKEANLSTLTQRYTEEAVKFIEESKDAPFFLYIPHTYPHIPLGASEKFLGKSPQGLYGDVVEELDWSVGEVLKTLKKLGLEENTLVMFTSDNGPWFQGSPGPLRGRKGSTNEGGVREPFIARWPGHIPAGRVCESVCCTIDILPTLSRVCEVAPPKAVLDGMDIWPLLSGKSSQVDRDILYFDNVNLQCIRRGRFKLHIARYNTQLYGPQPNIGRVNLPLKPSELYDLEADPEESYDVAAKYPEVVADLKARIERQLQTFPDNIKKAFSDTFVREVMPGTAGAMPRPVPK